MKNLKIFSIKSKSLILPIIFTFGILLIATSCGETKKEEYTVIKDAKYNDVIDKALAEKGEQIFKEKCSACHKYGEKYVGPSLGLVTKRRTANYIFSQIMNSEQMIKNNDTIKALMAQFPTPMPNQHLTMDQAKAVVEHLRIIAENGGTK